MSKTIADPTDCEERSVIRFLNTRNVKPAQIHRQLAEVYGENVMCDGMSAFTSRREQLESVSSTRERSVDICSRRLPLDERLYLAPSASVGNDLSANVNNRIANDFYKIVNIVHIFVCL
ncbi:hypothetical protein TNCV_3230631 [Trichonephila clavipes]|nr:hypothetical protein TNCV_3230631 [Trichonephila clavipes]